MQKKIIYFFIALFFVSFSVKGQRHEIGVQLGMSNLVGDIGRTNYILQKPLGNYRELGIPFYGGILYRRNFSPYQSIRVNVGYSHIQFSDAHAKEFYRHNRYLEGSNSIYEADVLFEYNFFQVNEEQESLLSPYIFGGIGAMLSSTPQFVVNNDFVRVGGVAQTPNANDPNSIVSTGSEEYISALSMAIPFGVGLKYKFNYRWALFGELMFRATFSDAIDYSTIDDKNIKMTYNKDILAPGSTTKSLLQESQYKTIIDNNVAELAKNRQVGNPNSKDWVNSITLGLSYSFGRPPCFCD